MNQTIAQIISREAASCPTGGLEFVLYPRAAVPSRTPRFEINLNAGLAMDYHLSFDPVSEPSHWFVLDISIVGEYGLQLADPPAREVFALRAERLPFVALRRGVHNILEG